MKLKSNGVVDNENTDFFMNVDEFNEYSILPSIDDLDSNLFQCGNGFTFRNVDSLEIFDAMTSIKTNSVGADGIPIKFLKIIILLYLGILRFF